MLKSFLTCLKREINLLFCYKTDDAKKNIIKLPKNVCFVFEGVGRINRAQEAGIGIVIGVRIRDTLHQVTGGGTEIKLLFF